MVSRGVVFHVISYLHPTNVGKLSVERKLNNPRLRVVPEAHQGFLTL